MTTPLLLEYYNQLPERQDDEETRQWTRRLRLGLEKFKHAAEKRYTEGTLQRLLYSSSGCVRQASVLALGMIGSMKANKSLAAMLHDRDTTVRQLASEGLWSLWFRADNSLNNKELQRLIRQSGSEERPPEQILAGFEALLKKSPRFAEAYNQRAIYYFRIGEMQKAIADCETVLKLNPYHFGASGGLAQCYMKLKKHRAALKAFRRTYNINPNLEGIPQTIRSLEKLLGEEGKR